MARFKKKRSRSRAFKKHYSKNSGGMKPESVVLPAVAYGAARQWLSNAAQPITSKIPLGNYADEALFGIGGYLLAKKGKGMIKQIGLAMLTVEAASVGHQVIGSKVSTQPTDTGNSQSW